MNSAYLNGSFGALEDTRIPVLDRGFIFGDGVYEVIPVYGGTLFRLEAHLHRLQNSLDGIRIANPHPPAEWQSLLYDLVAKNGGGDQSVYIQVTRGTAPRTHHFPADAAPTVFAMSSPLSSKPAATAVAAITRDDFRWQRCDIKTTALLASVLLRQEAAQAGAAEAILLRDGQLTEGAATNVFVVSDDLVKTPPKSHLLLPGITRDFVLELCAEVGVPFVETAVPESELRGASEIWISSSSLEVAPVSTLDGKPVGNGAVGPLAKQLWSQFQSHKQRLRAAA